MTTSLILSRSGLRQSFHGTLGPTWVPGTEYSETKP